MGRRLLFSSETKQQALALFRAGLGVATVARELDISRYVVNTWFERFRQGDDDWVNSDDDDFILRGKALALFQEGQGYKRVSTVLQLPTSRVKYWYQQFKFNHLDFFEVGQRTFKAYPKAYKEEILQAYKKSSLSKKAFCGQHKIAVVTLNQWLKTNEKNA